MVGLARYVVNYWTHLVPNESFLTVLSASMADRDELHRRRQGFWLRMAREANGMSQKEAADVCGLKTKAGVSDYENGITQVPQHRLRRLAGRYGWPLVIFTEPEPTAFEQAEARMARLARAAIRVAAEDAESEVEAVGPPASGEPAAPPHRRSA